MKLFVLLVLFISEKFGGCTQYILEILIQVSKNTDYINNQRRVIYYKCSSKLSFLELTWIFTINWAFVDIYYY